MAISLIETQIQVEKLEIGMRVVRLDKPWEETDFLLQGFVIESQDDIESLKRQCRYVFIEGRVEDMAVYGPHLTGQRKNERGRPKPARSGKKEGLRQKRVTYINKIRTEQELFIARETYSSTKTTIKNIMDGIRIGRAIDMSEARQAVDEVVDSILSNKDALLLLTKIKNKDEYTAEHSLNVCILTATFARHLGHEEGEIRKIGLCGLLHDVGKSKIPEHILTKAGRLTDEEFDLMKRHPVFGRDLLASLPKSEYAAIDVAHSHHERIDARGYPRGLTEQQIPYYAKVVSIVDCYDAITSNRCYDSARASMEALDIIYKGRGTQFDSELAVAFIKCIGIYPPGSIVELTNGYVGIVISTNSDNKLRPKVLLVRNAAKKLIREVVVDLNLNEYKSGNRALSIIHEIPNGVYGVKIEEYLARGLVLSRSKPDNDLSALQMRDNNDK